MTLDVGQRGIVAVRPWPSHAPFTVTWSCSRCGVEHPIRSSWSVRYRRPGRDDLEFVVCPACADAVRPLNLVVDADRLDAVPELPELRTTVEQVRALRHQDAPQVRLRDADVHELAARRHQDARALVALLEERGVLVRA